MRTALFSTLALVLLTGSVIAQAPGGNGANASYEMGKIVGYCLVGIVVLLIFKALFGKKNQQD